MMKLACPCASMCAFVGTSCQHCCASPCVLERSVTLACCSHWLQMLSWPAGPKPYDGVWAPWWYAGTHKSTGKRVLFAYLVLALALACLWVSVCMPRHCAPHTGIAFLTTIRTILLCPAYASPAGFEAMLQQLTPRRERPLPEHLQPLLEECRPLYALLRRHALRPLGSAGPRPLGSAEDAEQQVQKEAQQRQQQAQQGQQADSGSSGGVSGGQNTAQPQAMQCGSLAYLEDPRNEDVLVGMRDGVTGERHVMLCICEPAILAACHMWDGGTGVGCKLGSWA